MIYVVNIDFTDSLTKLFFEHGVTKTKPMYSFDSTYQGSEETGLRLKKIISSNFLSKIA